jgi:hypothetical protein
MPELWKDLRMEKIEAEFQVFLSMEVNVGRGRIIVVV